jgi:glucokinase
MGYYAGIDLGATHVRAAVADEDGVFLGTDKRRTPRTTGEAVTDAVLDALAAACDAAGVEPGGLWAVGVGSIGPLDPNDGAVVRPANLPASVERIELVQPLREAAATERVVLYNDATAAVVGERFYGATTPDNLVYLTISSGVGAGVMVDGHVLQGRGGNAAEVGHMVVDSGGLMECGCGHVGHWEAYCSGENIPDYARALAAEGDGDTALPLDDPGLSAADVFAHEGDPLADRVVERVTDWNAIGVANVVHAYAPSLVCVGGTVACENAERLVAPLEDRVADLVMTAAPEIRLTEFEEAVLRGAVASAIQRSGPVARRA